MLPDNQFTTSIWGDEGFSAILSMKPPLEIIKIIIKDTSPPLYNLTEHFAFQLFGTSEVVIRGLSFFYYLLTILFVYLIVDFLWDKKTALLAAALSFFNPFFFIYAFEGRMYSIMALGVAASMYFFIRLVSLPKPRSKKEAKTPPYALLTGYIFSTAWALYSHHFAIFTLFVQGLWFIYFFFTKRHVVKWIFMGFLGAGLVYLPWLYPLYRQTKMVGGGFWLGTPTIKDLFNLTTQYLAEGIKHPLAKPALVAAVSILVFRDWTKKGRDSLILVSWFLGPIIMAWAISQVFTSVFYNRYLLYTIPGAMILLATNRRGKLSIILLGILLGLFIRIDYYYFFHPIKRPFQELSTLVLKSKQEGDILINFNAGSHHLWESKYYGIPAPIYVPSGGELPYFVGTALMEDSDIINEIPENTNRVGVITSGSIDEILVPGYTEIVDKFELKDLNFVWLKRKN